MQKCYIKLLLISCLLVSGAESLFAQVSENISVTYFKEISTFIDTSKVSSNKRSISNLNRLIDKNSKQLFFELSVDGYHSFFDQKKTLTSDIQNEPIAKLAASLGGTKGSFYINKRDSVFINHVHFSGEDFRIKLTTKNWHITEETKYIDKYQCYKAVSVDRIVNPKGVFEHPVVAWFSPELPSFFGPASYFGLPGMILELDNGKIRLVVHEIVFEGAKKLKAPKKGIVVTPSQYDSIVEKAAENFFGRSKFFSP